MKKNNQNPNFSNKNSENWTTKSMNNHPYLWTFFVFTVVIYLITYNIFESIIFSLALNLLLKLIVIIINSFTNNKISYLSLNKNNLYKDLIIIPVVAIFGGERSVGIVSTIIENNDEIIVLNLGKDSSLEGYTYGIDFASPDIDYLISKKNKIKGMIITNNNYNHISLIDSLIGSILLDIELPKISNIFFKNINYPQLYISNKIIEKIKKRMYQYVNLGNPNIKKYILKENMVITIGKYIIYPFISKTESIVDYNYGLNIRDDLSNILFKEFSKPWGNIQLYTQLILVGSKQTDIYNEYICDDLFNTLSNLFSNIKERITLVHSNMQYPIIPDIIKMAFDIGLTVSVAPNSIFSDSSMDELNFQDLNIDELRRNHQYINDKTLHNLILVNGSREKHLSILKRSLGDDVKDFSNEITLYLGMSYLNFED